MDALELIVLCVWSFTVALAGGAVGLVLGNIRLPLVLLVASSPAAGAGANIGISGVAAFAAAAAHIRAGRINWRLFAWMAPPSMAGAIVGGLISGAISDTALLIVIGVALVYFGVDLLRPKAESRPPERSGELDIRAAVVSGAVIAVLGAGAAASIPGALLGAGLTGRMSERQLLRAIGAVLVVAGSATAVQALL